MRDRFGQSVNAYPITGYAIEELAIAVGSIYRIGLVLAPEG